MQPRQKFDNSAVNRKSEHHGTFQPHFNKTEGLNLSEAPRNTDCDDDSLLRKVIFSGNVTAERDANNRRDGII